MEHFKLLEPRLERVAGALSRLIPNLGGPRGSVRLAYVRVVHVVALYGAPVWAPQAAANPRIKRIMCRAQRKVAARASRCYRTVSHAAATIMSGTPPMKLLAKMYAETYRRTSELKRNRGMNTLPGKIKAALKDHARRSMREEWDRYLADPSLPGQRTVGAIRSVLQEWTDGARRGITFRTAQVLPGHGCFGSYLCRIGKEATTHCAHCEATEDTADHTLAQCPAWAVERRVLQDKIGMDLALPAVIAATVQSEENWQAFSSFCENVISQKEEAEHKRERRGERVRRARASQRDRRALARIARVPLPPLLPATSPAQPPGTGGRGD